MSNLSVSFFSLVKHNGGFFKSEKQANFLQSKLHNGQYAADHGNNMLTVFTCDNEGVLLVEKVRTVKGKRVWSTVFNRKDPSVAQNLADKEYARKEKAQKREVKKALQHLNDVKSQKSSYAKSEGYKALFNKSIIEHSKKAGIAVDESILFPDIRYNLNSIYQVQIERIRTMMERLIINTGNQLPIEKFLKLQAMKDSIQEKLTVYNNGE